MKSSMEKGNATRGGQAHIGLRFFLVDTGTVDVMRSALFMLLEFRDVLRIDLVTRKHLLQLAFCWRRSRHGRRCRSNG